MKNILIFILLALPSCVYAQETITLTSAQTIIVENTDGVDITAVGSKWEVQVAQDDWMVAGKMLYPDKDDRTQAVKGAQNDIKIQFGIYLNEAIMEGKDIGYVVQKTGTGLSLDSVTTFTYTAFCFKDEIICEVFFRQNNKQYSLLLFPDLSDETAAATTARAAIVTAFSTISTAANLGPFIK